MSKDPNDLSDFFAKYGASQQGTPTGAMPNVAERALQASRQGDLDVQRRQIAYIEKNSANGVRFDPYRGLPASLRALGSFERDPKKRAAFYERQEGVSAVRFDNQNRLILRVTDEDGMPIDVLEDEASLTVKDFTADLAGDIPAIAAQALAAKATGGMSLLGQAATIALSGAGAQVASDYITRGAMGSEQDSAESFTNAGIGAAFDFAMPLAPAGAKRAAQSVFGRSQFSSDFERKSLVEAVAHLKKVTGRDIHLSPAEKLGSTKLARLETFAESMESSPGALKKMSDQLKLQDEQRRAVIQHILGTDKRPIPTGEDLTQGAGQILADGLNARNTTINNAWKQAGQAAEDGLLTSIAQRTGNPALITASEAGDLVRKRVSALRDQFKAQNKANYDEVYSQTGAKLPMFETKGIKQTLEQIAKEQVPAKPVVETINTGLFDTAGRPIALTKTEERPLQSLIPPELKKFLGIIDELPDKYRLQDLVNMRTQVSDLIENGTALPGVPQRHLKALSHAITETIETTLDKLPDTGFKNALVKANTYYKTNVDKFQETGVYDLFRPATEGSGFVANETIIDRVFAGKGSPDLLSRYKRVLGAGSQEYKAILRAGYNQILDRSDRRVGGFIDAGSFINSINSMRPEVRAEMLGIHGDAILKNADLLAGARGKKIDPEVLEQIMRGPPSAAAQKLKLAVDLEKARDDFYTQQIVKGFTNGLMDPSKIDADEFVVRFFDRGSVGQINDVIRRIDSADPQLGSDIRRKLIQDALLKASRSFTATDAASTIAGRTEVPIDAAKMTQMLAKDDYGLKLRRVIGDDAMKTLLALTTIETARMKKREVGRQSGQLVSAGVLASLLQGNIKEAPTVLKFRILSVLLTTPGLDKVLTSQQIPNTPKLRRAIFSSPAFVRGLVSEFGEDEALLGQVTEVLRLDSDMNADIERSLQRYQMSAPMGTRP